MAIDTKELMGQVGKIAVRGWNRGRIIGCRSNTEGALHPIQYSFAIDKVCIVVGG